MPNKARKLHLHRHRRRGGPPGFQQQTFRSRTGGITMKSFIGMLLGLLTISESLALRLTTVRIPTYKFRGESALLECQYELNGQQPAIDTGYGHRHQQQQQWQKQPTSTRSRTRNDSQGDNRYPSVPSSADYLDDSDFGFVGERDDQERLYSIKWYKDNEEFYRYVPSAKQPIKSYKIDGIRVDPNYSDGSKVLLKVLSLKSSGVYRCEISAEAPNFDSVQGEGRMDVIYVPKDGPHINGSERRSYHIGETMELNCTSGRSYPASTLQWYLNDQLVTDPGSIVYYPRLLNQHGLVTSFLGLRMVVHPRHYIDGVMRIKCVASLSPVLWRNGKESIVQWEQPTIDNRVAMLLVKSSSCRWLPSTGLLMLCSALLYIICESCRSTNGCSLKG
ncbi:uncharacterized protein LOC129729457 [Wyeomyia smithii]|uniref:uncharacterized protein LOC129729457 n=1 Tax=Wyeomyia smithii TaxID=174621 RepID=UPI0024681171|nr:uncharacterized protein LOC129729457 [Wyeomyia smithii]XP_055544013.1 uncharacterized protein LOC129729457 [Wyeomyia smithii]XP_055544014.1 uncharacterized protein LOC129729457 [Wyeomyia smithii]XP_055544015.1 uncharacterized protein LOC129729457 [Wyeomyia smithii]XP_055544016.1 uncharacterized protein LOC129729457 [Wyeomyia smithii]